MNLADIEVTPEGSFAKGWKITIRFSFDNGTFAAGEFKFKTDKSSDVKETLLGMASHIEACEDITWSDGITNYYESD